jgi:signal transduction histidine kinase
MRAVRRLGAGEVVDALVALALFAVAAYEVLVRPLGEDVVQGPPALNLAAAALGTLPIALRRSRPLPVLVVVFGAIAARSLVSEPLELYPPLLAGLVAVYSCSVYCTARDAVLGIVVAALGLAVTSTQGTGGSASVELGPALVLVGIVWGVGRAAGIRHTRAIEAETAAAERDRRREEEMQAALAEQRSRIARELHDSVSHTLALIALQAGGAQEVIDSSPARAAESLRLIERAARSGLREMRGLLGALGGEDGADRAPQPGIAMLDELVGGARAAGLAVDLREEGARPELAPGTGTALYRILQEALTNAARHGLDSRASVVLRWRADAVELEVANPAPPGDGVSDGRGLIGMRERASLGGGTLAVASGNGTFRICARLPLEART